MESFKSYNQLVRDNEELRLQLEEATETIEAIRTGQVDAFIVQGEKGNQLYTLKTADQAYRVFIEKMNEGAVTINRDGIILYSNSRFASMVDLPLEKVLGVCFETFIPHQSQADFNELINNGWKEDCKGEIFLQDNNKNQTSCLLSCNTLELDEGVALSLILTDLTSQKAIQQQLKLQNEQLETAQNFSAKLNDELEATVKSRTKELYVSREHFKFLADNIPVIVWTAQPDGNLTYFNQRWYDYTGYSLEETKGWAWQRVVHPDDLETTLDAWKRSIATGQKYEIEYRFKQGSDNQYRWHLGYALPFKDEEGNIFAWFGTATDIEDQKKAMEKKDEFIGVASHELKTPLTSLKGYLQLISSYKKEELPLIVKQYLDKANLAINKLQYLVNDLLDVSKINAGRLDYSMSKINITDIVNSCIENAVHVYPSYNFELHNDTDYLVNGNAERLEQVLMNLVNNAVKYSKENKTVIIETAKHAQCVRVSVKDFGIGLSENQIDRIFERFYRVEDKKYMTSGLGMGLYISAEIMNTHNGEIGVESELGKGSTFYFDVPLV